MDYRSILNRIESGLYSLTGSIPEEDPMRERFQGRMDQLMFLVGRVSDHIRPPYPTEVPPIYHYDPHGNGAAVEMEQLFDNLVLCIERGYGSSENMHVPRNSVQILRECCRRYIEDVGNHQNQ